MACEARRSKTPVANASRAHPWSIGRGLAGRRCEHVEAVLLEPRGLIGGKQGEDGQVAERRRAVTLAGAAAQHSLRNEGKLLAVVEEPGDHVPLEPFRGDRRGEALLLACHVEGRALGAADHAPRRCGGQERYGSVRLSLRRVGATLCRGGVEARLGRGRGECFVLGRGARQLLVRGLLRGGGTVDIVGATPGPVAAVVGGWKRRVVAVVIAPAAVAMGRGLCRLVVISLCAAAAAGAVSRRWLVVVPPWRSARREAETALESAPRVSSCVAAFGPVQNDRCSVTGGNSLL